MALGVPTTKQLTNYVIVALVFTVLYFVLESWVTQYRTQNALLKVFLLTVVGMWVCNGTDLCSVPSY